jgi:hypothetical protein
MAAPHLAVASAAALTVVTQSGRHQHTPVAVNGLCRRSLWTLPACPPAAFDGDTCYSGFCCPSCMSLGHGCCNSTAIQRLGTLHRPAAAWLQQQHPLALHSSSASASLATADPKRHPPDCGGQQLGSCRVAMFMWWATAGQLQGCHVQPGAGISFSNSNSTICRRASKAADCGM